MANIKEARKCQACEGMGMDAYGYTCHACNGYGAVVTSTAPEEPPAAEPEEYVRKVIVPQADQFADIAKRLKEIEAERQPPAPQAETPPTNQFSAEQEDYYAWGY